MTPTDKPPCLPGCDHLLWKRPTLPVPTTSIAHTFHAPGCPNAPAARCECGADDYNARLQKGTEYVPVTPLPHALNCPKRPAPTPEPPRAACARCGMRIEPGIFHSPDGCYSVPKPEAESVDFEAANFFVEHLEAGPCSDCPSYLSNLGRAYLALRAELAAKDEKLRGLDYLYGELGNQNSFLRAELAEAKAEINRYNAALRDLVGDAALLKDQLAAERLLVRMQSAEAWTTGPSREASEAATAILAARSAKGGAK